MGLFDALGGIFDTGNHDSVLGALGGQFQKYTDPLAWIGGDKWVNLTSNEIPRASNQLLSEVVKPFDKVDEAINPVRRIGFVDDVGDVIRDKPASAIGTAIGGIFAAPALGIGGAGAAGGGASTAIGSAGGSGLFGTGVGGGSVAGGTAAGYGGGIASTALPGILPSATVGAGSGAAGTFGGALGTGSLTGAAGGMFGPTIGAQGMGTMEAIRLGNQGRSLMSQQDQEQQRAQQATAQQQAALAGGGGGGNMRGLFSSLMQQPKYGQVKPTAGLLNLGGY